MAKSLDGKVHHRHRRGPRHRARDRAAVRCGRRQGRGQRSRRRRRWFGIERCTGRGSGRGNQEARRHGGSQFRERRRSHPRQQDRQDGDRSFRQARRRRQQCRHPARRDLPPHEHRCLRVRHQGASDGLVLCLARRGAAVPRAGERLVRALHLDLGPGRQFRPGQLRRGQARHRRPVEIDRARHGAASTCAPTASRRSPGAA